MSVPPIADTEISGKLIPLWYRKFEPYLAHKVQIIASDGMVFVSSAQGLVALDAETGADKWVYATKLPLGHSPTIAEGVAYVGGYDRRLHAVDAQTGARLWVFQAEAGFDTSPLVVEGVVYLGCRDGYLYAVHASGENAGQLKWKYQTDGPIHFSAAYKEGVLYFASNDGHACALSADDGNLVWKSELLYGQGFYSYWPVIREDRVIFAGSNNYRGGVSPGAGINVTNMELQLLPLAGWRWRPSVQTPKIFWRAYGCVWKPRRCKSSGSLQRKPLHSHG